MLFRRFFIVLWAIAGVVCSTPSMAQDKVAVRTGANTGYERLVFQWAAKPEYSVSKEGGRILVRFAKAGTLDTAGVAGNKNVQKIETLSKGTEPLQVAVTIPDGSRFRDFVVDNKLIIDVYDADGAAKTTAKPVEEKVETAKAETAKEETPKGDFSVKPAEPEEAVPVHPVEATKVAAPAIEPHTITLTSTTSTGMTVFTRNGWLWIVLDAMDLPNAPKLEGPQVSKFPAMEKIELQGGVAYRMDLPEGTHVYGEGGGLSWKIVLTQTPKEVTPVLPSAVEAKLVWPLKEMRNVLTFADPVIGDKITVVTATNAAQFTGTGRSFVNLRTLDSAIGLAFVPKSDDVTAEKTLTDVKVGRPGGLALSDARDAASENIRKAMAEEKKPAAEEPAKTDEAKPEEKPGEHADAKPGEDMKLTEAPPSAEEAKAEAAPVEEKPVTAASKDELSQAGEAKPTGNNIYNFARWEMGGVPALEKNLHVMMVEISNKKEELRNEDILTMAKLNLANNRGAEALGLLRIAVLKVPELEDNAEFQALRGAALALSKKYDEAVIDYSRTDLKKYDDIKYWLAFTLGGLEDWKQAFAVMPKKFEPIAAYPREIKIPLILMFAEIALRGGDVPLANKILEILKPELPKLPLAYASSWNYLEGEAQRQANHPDKAIEYWSPLVKNGKDDLFRAKAGLSLTKLELDLKKIKADEAINRLEGLRYAWRGDELETLINYRLGQIYIDNKDYLKGLTVLRNAASLPSQPDMNKQVMDYMTSTFRQVFNNDRLKAISPLEAISLHEEFKDLLPPGEEGDRFVEKLAERLVEADLLGRAASLLEYQVNNRLQGDKKAEIAIRLAAIRLLDGNPDGALRSLEVAQDTLDKMNGVVRAPAEEAKPEDVKPEAGEAAPAAAAEKKEEAKAEPAKVEPQKGDPEKQRQILLLKARALSMQKKTDEAMAILEGMRLDGDVNRLRTDIAWTAGRWEEAAMALNDLIVTEDVSAKRPLTDYQRDIILNRAIALNLSGNRVALANLRERYNAQMKDTAKGQMFEVVTRPRRPDMVGSREAIDSMMSEIDLFKGFLDSYAKTEGSKGGAKAPSGVKEPVPVEGGKLADAKTPEAEKTVTKLPEEGEHKAEEKKPEAEAPKTEASH